MKAAFNHIADTSPLKHARQRTESRTSYQIASNKSDRAEERQFYGSQWFLLTTRQAAVKQYLPPLPSGIKSYRRKCIPDDPM